MSSTTPACPLRTSSRWPVTTVHTETALSDVVADSSRPSWENRARRTSSSVPPVRRRRSPTGAGLHQGDAAGPAGSGDGEQPTVGAHVEQPTRQGEQAIHPARADVVPEKLSGRPRPTAQVEQPPVRAEPGALGQPGRRERRDDPLHVDVPDLDKAGAVVAFVEGDHEELAVGTVGQHPLQRRRGQRHRLEELRREVAGVEEPHPPRTEEGPVGDRDLQAVGPDRDHPGGTQLRVRRPRLPPGSARRRVVDPDPGAVEDGERLPVRADLEIPWDGPLRRPHDADELRRPASVASRLARVSASSSSRRPWAASRRARSSCGVETACRPMRRASAARAAAVARLAWRAATTPAPPVSRTITAATASRERSRRLTRTFRCSSAAARSRATARNASSVAVRPGPRRSRQSRARASRAPR